MDGKPIGTCTLYIMPGLAHYGEMLADRGRHKTGKAWLYINKLADVDEE